MLDLLSKPQTWLIITFILLILELLSLSFELIWGAFATAITALVAWLFPLELTGLFITFSISLLIALVFARPILRKRFNVNAPNQTNDRMKAMIGKTGRVVSLEPLRIRLDDTEWAAIGEGMKIDDTIEVRGHKSTRLLIVKK